MNYLIAAFSILNFLSSALADDFVDYDKILINEKKSNESKILNAGTGRVLESIVATASVYNKSQMAIYSIYFDAWLPINQPLKLKVEKRFNNSAIPAVTYDLSYLHAKYNTGDHLKFSPDGKFVAFESYNHIEKDKCVLASLTDKSEIREFIGCRYIQFSINSPHIYLVNEHSLEKRNVFSQALEFSCPREQPEIESKVLEIKLSENSDLASVRFEWSQFFCDLKNKKFLGQYSTATELTGDNLFLDKYFLLTSVRSRTVLVDMRDMSEKKVLDHRCDKLWTNLDSNKIICVNSANLYVYNYTDLNLIKSIKDENSDDETILFDRPSNRIFWHNKMWDLTSGRVIWSR